MAYGKKDETSEYLKLNEDLRNQDFRPMYLLYGVEEYLKLSYKKSFRKAFGGEEGLCYDFFDGAPDVDVLIDTVRTFPMSFTGTGRLVIVQDSGWFKKTPPEKLTNFLADEKEYPETGHLMFIETEIDKRNKLYKIVSSRGFVCELGPQSEAQLSRWGARYLDNAGKKIRNSTMQLLLSMTGSRMDNIASELEKLIAYVGDREVIEDQDITTICSRNVEDQVFQMITELSLGNKEKAMQYYADLMLLQEAPMKILALMRRNFNQLLLAKESMDARMAPADGAKYTNVSPWIYKKLCEQARHYTKENLEEYLSDCYHYDAAIKNGNIADRTAVELLLCR